MGTRSTPELTAITPTRDRPAAFELCLRWMRRQTYTDQVQWIVVDDGDIPIFPMIECAIAADGMPKNISIWYLRRPPSTEVCTLQENLVAALHVALGEGLVVWEDDEFYAPNYLETMAKLLMKADLVGEKNAHYYNVSDRRWFIPDNQKHASLCRTGFRRKLIDKVVAICHQSKAQNDVFVDLRMWGMNGHPHIAPVAFLQAWSGMSVGIKGMPGRGGLGKNHKRDTFPNHDKDLKVLREWIGPDAADYERFLVRA